MTLVQVILGKFQSDTILKQSPILGSATFILYNIVIIFIALNIFFTILTESFSKLKSDINSDEEFEFVNFLFQKIKSFFARFYNMSLNTESNVKADTVKLLPFKFDVLLNKLDKV